MPISVVFYMQIDETSLFDKATTSNINLTTSFPFNFQHTRRKGGLAGGSIPNDQRTIPEKIFPQNRPRNVEAARVRDRPEAASAAEDGVYPEVHGLRNTLHHDEEEAQLQSLWNRKSFRILLS